MVEIEAKVATILDSLKVVLNVGSDNGVAETDRVTLWRVVEVHDPDTGEILGRVRVDNLTLRIMSVQPRLSIAAVPQPSILPNFPFSSSPARRISIGGSGDNKVIVAEGDEATVYGRRDE